MNDDLREAADRLDDQLADGKPADPRDLRLVLRALVDTLTEAPSAVAKTAPLKK